MRFRLALASAATLALFGSVAGCGSNADETHGVGKGGNGSGASGNGSGGSAGTIPTMGGSAGTIPTMGGTTGTGDTTGAGGNDMCAMTTATATPEAPVLMLLVDTSQSMTTMAPGGGTRWSVTQTALADAFTTLRDGINVGLVFFPDVPTGSMPCFDSMTDVAIAPLDATQRGLLSTAVQMQMPSGSTPTHDAYRYALDQLRASTLAGQKYVVLITDGEPTYALGCMGSGQPGQMPPTPTQPLIDESAMAMSGGIRTFVIGSPGSEAARTSLSQMASQGGTAQPGCNDMGPQYCHLDMTTQPNFSTALNDALDQVIAGIPLSCEFNLPPPPSGMELDRTKVNVTYKDGTGTNTDLGRDTSGMCTSDGWDYTPDGSQIRLCGALCDQVKADPSASITIVLGCATRPVVH